MSRKILETIKTYLVGTREELYEIDPIIALLCVNAEGLIMLSGYKELANLSSASNFDLAMISAYIVTTLDMMTRATQTIRHLFFDSYDTVAKYSREPLGGFPAIVGIIGTIREYTRKNQ